MGTVLSGSNLPPVPTHQVPESTVMNRSLGWKWGRLIWCGPHLIRTMYGPGLLGSPRITASFAPSGVSFHSIWLGNLYASAAGLRSALAGMSNITTSNTKVGTE